MPREVEVKLALPATEIREVAQLPWLRDLAAGTVRRETLTSVYFDTPEYRLHRHELTLRVRQEGDKWLQTIKLSQNGSAADLGRDEWEAQIAGPAPELSLAKHTALAPLTTKRLRGELDAVFETVVERITLPVRTGGSQIEIAIDQGYIEAADRREPINEIELELKRGDIADLVRLTEQFADALPVAYGVEQKPDRG